MDEIIEKLLSIDNRAKSLISEYEEKRQNLDVFISEEISKRKKEIDSKYKFRIDFKNREYERKLKNKIKIMQEIKENGIEELKRQYNLEKKRLVDDMYNSIISN